MTQVISQHGHDDMIHDAVLDYYGRRLATCSSDKTIKIFEVEGENHKIIDSLRGHEGAVWSISWAHPKYGPILASSSYDGKVIIWRETTPSSSSPHTYTRLIDFALHSASVNLICWSPHELGALLACASSDGCVSVLSFNDTAANASGQGAWDTTVFQAHDIGCNSVSWGPSLLPGSLEKAQAPGQGQQEAVRRLATAGSDCLVKLWEYSIQAGGYNQICTLQGHSDWVRDVAWSPSLLGKSYIASASQDKTVRIWTLAAGLEPGDAANWQHQVLSFECVIWRVSWSLSGNVLAVSGGDNRVGLWKERIRDGGWECVKTLEE